MKRLLAVMLFGWCCSGCCLLQERSNDLTERYARPEDLSLTISLDRDKRIFRVSLRYTGTQEAYVDYYRPGFKLFCVSEGIGVRVLKGDCDMKGLYSIPKMTTRDKISYELPVERFAFFNPEVIVRDCLLFVEYNSRWGSKCSNTIRISEPLSLGPLNDGNETAYRAIEVTNEANAASR